MYNKGIPKSYTNFLHKAPDEVPRFVTKKWIEVHDHSGNAEDRYKPREQIRFKTSMLRSVLCHFSDAYIAAKVKINVKNPNNDLYDKKLALKNNAPFVSCISTFNNRFIDNAEGL